MLYSFDKKENFNKKGESAIPPLAINRRGFLAEKRNENFAPNQKEKEEIMVPNWYNSDRCGKLRMCDTALVAASAAQLRQNKPQTKRQKNILAVIDMQIDFIHPQGALSVPGAIEDTDRLNRFIFNNLDNLSHIVASLDTHYLYQPFHPYNWIAGSKPASRNSGVAYKEFEHPDPFTIITSKDIANDVWRPVKHPKAMIHMLEQLESQSKKQLCVWPLHCMLGTPGHAFDPSFMEAMLFHSVYSSDQYDATVKGLSQLSEHYGILQAEVEFPEDPKTSLNVNLLRKWEEADSVYFAGQARTHCVLETLNQIVRVFERNNKKDLLKKLVILEDCMSNVPDIKDSSGNVIVPFAKWADDRFAEFRGMGFRFGKSTDIIK